MGLPRRVNAAIDASCERFCPEWTKSGFSQPPRGRGSEKPPQQIVRV